MFETRSHTWHDVGLARQLSRRAARRARIQVVLLAPLLGGVLFLYAHRKSLTGTDTPIRAVTVVALLMLGWAIVRDLGRAVGPALFRRMGELLGPLHEESYAHVDEVKGDAYGFGGLTQERRYIAGQLEVAPRRAAA